MCSTPWLGSLLGSQRGADAGTLGPAPSLVTVCGATTGSAIEPGLAAQQATAWGAVAGIDVLTPAALSTSARAAGGGTDTPTPPAPPWSNALAIAAGTGGGGMQPAWRRVAVSRRADRALSSSAVCESPAVLVLSSMSRRSSIRVIRSAVRASAYAWQVKVGCHGGSRRYGALHNGRRGWEGAL